MKKKQMLGSLENLTGNNTYSNDISWNFIHGSLLFPQTAIKVVFTLSLIHAVNLGKQIASKLEKKVFRITFVKVSYFPVKFDRTTFPA